MLLVGLTEESYTTDLPLSVAFVGSRRCVILSALQLRYRHYLEDTIYLVEFRGGLTHRHELTTRA